MKKDRIIKISIAIVAIILLIILIILLLNNNTTKTTIEVDTTTTVISNEKTEETTTSTDVITTTVITTSEVITTTNKKTTTSSTTTKQNKDTNQTNSNNNTNNTVTYSCPEGYTLISNNKCETTTWKREVCEGEWHNYSDGKCINLNSCTTVEDNSNCPAGTGSMDFIQLFNNEREHKCCTTKTAPIKCDEGYTLNGDICRKIIDATKQG